VCWLLNRYGVTHLDAASIYHHSEHAALAVNLVLEPERQGLHLATGFAIADEFHGHFITYAEHLAGLGLAQVQTGDGDVLFHLAGSKAKIVQCLFVDEQNLAFVSLVGAAVSFQAQAGDGNCFLDRV